MRREEIDRLLARLSSGELTSAEREALYNAALEDQALFEEIFAEQALQEALSDQTIRDEFLSAEKAREREAAAKAEKRRIPWWGWAVPAAVAASTVIGVILLREPARDAQLAQRTTQQPIVAAQTQLPEAVAESAPAPVVEEIAAPRGKSKAAVAFEGKGEIAQELPKKTGPVLVARRDESKSLDLKDQAAPMRANEVASAPAAPSAAQPPAAVTAVGGVQVAGRPVEAESRPAPAQVAEFRAAVPNRQMEAREASGAAVRKEEETVMQARAKTTAAERGPALALRSSAGLQAQDAAGDWQDVPAGGRVARGAKLRVKVTAHEPGAWTLAGKVSRSVQLAANETAYFDLPSFESGLNSVDLTFRPGSQAVMRLRSGAEGGRLGRVRISFTVE